MQQLSFSSPGSLVWCWEGEKSGALLRPRPGQVSTREEDHEFCSPWTQKTLTSGLSLHWERELGLKINSSAAGQAQKAMEWYHSPDQKKSKQLISVPNVFWHFPSGSNPTCSFFNFWKWIQRNQHLLSSFYIPHTGLSALHALSYLIIHTIMWGVYF